MNFTEPFSPVKIGIENVNSGKVMTKMPMIGRKILHEAPATEPIGGSDWKPEKDKTDSMIYVLSHGNYSEYDIQAVMQTEGGKDFKGLWREFESLYHIEYIDYISKTEGIYDWEADEYPHLIELGKELDLQPKQEAGTTIYPCYYDLFTAWLVKNHGFTVLEYDEMNLE